MIYMDADAATLAHLADLPSVCMSPNDRRALLRGAQALERLARQPGEADTVPPPTTREERR